MSICCFAGHNMIYDDNIKSEIYNLCVNLITNENVNEFFVGNYGEFDLLCGNIISRLKDKYKDIKLHLVIPYITKNINENKNDIYKKYDSIIIPEMNENTPNNVKIIKANEYMIKKSQFVICYVYYSWGGAFKTYNYAKRKNINIINIAEKYPNESSSSKFN